MKSETFIQKFLHFLVILILLLILGSSQVIKCMTEAARANPTSSGIDEQGSSAAAAVATEEEKVALRAQIGSRPPRCERRCSWCEHCEAIQVPTNPDVHGGHRKSSAGEFSRQGYDRGGEDNYSNYKPMSWKCKCGNIIFNP